MVGTKSSERKQISSTTTTRVLFLFLLSYAFFADKRIFHYISFTANTIGANDYIEKYLQYKLTYSGLCATFCTLTVICIRLQTDTPLDKMHLMQTSAINTELVGIVHFQQRFAVFQTSHKAIPYSLY